MPDRRRAEVAGDRLCFEIGKHLVRLEKRGDAWTASVDGLSGGAHHPSQAEAWRHGVQAALALDAPAPAPARAHHQGQAQPSPRDRISGAGTAGVVED
jgi:hypothetical protein